MKISLILACAGKGVRAGFSQNKLLEKIDGKPCFMRALEVFIKTNLFDQILITASQEDFSLIKELVGEKAEVILGGKTRTDSVKNALTKVDNDIVLIHDGARPFVTNKMIEDCINTAKEFGSAIPVIPCRDTLIKSDGKIINEYLGKADCYSVQTPQGFNTQLIKRAYACAGEKVFNDDGEVYKTFIGEVSIYNGDLQNKKLTFKEDFTLSDYRFGTGFDCHKLVEDRKLILGGVEIPHDKGLLGHSDADVLTHAIMDALLSSLALRDIGYHFSDKDPKYKDANSIDLLKKVLKMIEDKGYKVHNVSATIMAEKPKLKDVIPIITKNLASVLGLNIESIGIGATTLEGLGFIGREEGICVYASATVVKSY